MSTALHMEATPAGISNAKLGTWLFLASEVMLFGALFASYIILRTGSEIWPRGADLLNIPLATLNTFILIASSMTMVMAFASVQRDDRKGFRNYLLATILLGAAFLVVKGFEYGAKFHHGILPSTSIFYACYFTLTGLHGLHVVGGIIANLCFLTLGLKDWEHPLFPGRIECAGLYWHFVDIVWIFLFPSLYLL